MRGVTGLCVYLYSVEWDCTGMCLIVTESFFNYRASTMYCVQDVDAGNGIGHDGARSVGFLTADTGDACLIDNPSCIGAPYWPNHDIVRGYNAGCPAAF